MILASSLIGFLSLLFYHSSCNNHLDAIQSHFGPSINIIENVVYSSQVSITIDILSHI